MPLAKSYRSIATETKEFAHEFFDLFPLTKIKKWV